MTKVNNDSLKTMFIGLLIIFFIFMAFAIYKKDDILSVANQIKESFTSSNEDNNDSDRNLKIAFRLFYTDWCPHCQTTKPEWDKMMNNWMMTKRQMYWQNNRLNYKDIKIEKVNCEKDKNTCKEFDIGGYPTIVLSIGNKNIEYNRDGRSHSDLISFLEAQLQSNGIKLEKLIYTG